MNLGLGTAYVSSGMARGRNLGEGMMLKRASATPSARLHLRAMFRVPLIDLAP